MLAANDVQSSRAAESVCGRAFPRRAIPRIKPRRLHAKTVPSNSKSPKGFGPKARDQVSKAMSMGISQAVKSRTIAINPTPRRHAGRLDLGLVSQSLQAKARRAGTPARPRIEAVMRTVISISPPIRSFRTDSVNERTTDEAKNRSHVRFVRGVLGARGMSISFTNPSQLARIHAGLDGRCAGGRLRRRGPRRPRRR